MDRLGKSDRPFVVAAAVAHDLNDDLTVILNSVARTIASLDPDDPTVTLLIDLQSAAQRCAWRAAGLLNYSAQKGHLTAPLSVDRLLEEEKRRR